MANAHLGFSFPPVARVLVSSDNSTVISYINREGGTRSFSLWRETERVVQLVINLQISIRAVHIPGNMNVIADLLSRQDQTLPTEWSLNLEITKHLFLLWCSPHMDLFETRWNAKLQTFASLVPDPQALAVDALSLSWQNLWAYTFPPHQLLTKVLTKLLQSNAQLTLVAPAWLAQPWFPDLLDMSVDHPRQLPVTETLLKQPRSDRFHLDPGRL